MNANHVISKEEARFALIAAMLARNYEKLSALSAAFNGSAAPNQQIICGPSGLAGQKENISTGVASPIGDEAAFSEKQLFPLSGGEGSGDGSEIKEQAARLVDEYEMIIALSKAIEVTIRIKSSAMAI